MQIASKVSPEIRIERLDESGTYDRFTISDGEISYTLVASEPCLTFGDVESLSIAPRPTGATAGCVAQLVNLHDPEAAARTGNRYGRSRLVRLAVLEGAAGVHPGEYHDLSTFGSAPPLEPANDANPLFVGVLHDVTEEFRDLSLPEQLQARLDIGRVFQRVCVDSDPTRVWHPDLPHGIVFGGCIAPDLDDLNPRELAGLLMEAGFLSSEAFSEEPVVRYAQTSATALELLGGVTSPLPGPEAETWHQFRLHSDPDVQDECYREMSDAAVSTFGKMPCEGLLPVTAPRSPQPSFGV
jgi:hypothetical protein